MSSPPLERLLGEPGEVGGGRAHHQREVHGERREQRRRGVRRRALEAGAQRAQARREVLRRRRDVAGEHRATSRPAGCAAPRPAGLRGRVRAPRSRPATRRARRRARTRARGLRGHAPAVPRRARRRRATARRRRAVRRARRPFPAPAARRGGSCRSAVRARRAAGTRRPSRARRAQSPHRAAWRSTPTTCSSAAGWLRNRCIAAPSTPPRRCASSSAARACSRARSDRGVSSYTALRTSGCTKRSGAERLVGLEDLRAGERVGEIRRRGGVEAAKRRGGVEVRRLRRGPRTRARAQRRMGPDAPDAQEDRGGDALRRHPGHRRRIDVLRSRRRADAAARRARTDCRASRHGRRVRARRPPSGPGARS